MKVVADIVSAPCTVQTYLWCSTKHPAGIQNRTLNYL